MRTVYNQSDTESLPALLVGRRIVDARLGPTATPEHSGYEGALILDDGTALLLAGNDGCGGCSNGFYRLTAVAKTDNVITSARIHADPSDNEDTLDGVYRIFVYAGNTEIAAASWEGTDGNGYYGTGFEVWVVRP